MQRVVGAVRPIQEDGAVHQWLQVPLVVFGVAHVNFSGATSEIFISVNMPCIPKEALATHHVPDGITTFRAAKHAFRYLLVETRRCAPTIELES